MSQALDRPRTLGCVGLLTSGFEIFCGVLVVGPAATGGLVNGTSTRNMLSAGDLAEDGDELV